MPFPGKTFRPFKHLVIGFLWLRIICGRVAVLPMWTWVIPTQDKRVAAWVHMTPEVFDGYRRSEWSRVIRGVPVQRFVNADRSQVSAGGCIFAALCIAGHEQGPTGKICGRRWPPYTK